MCFYLEFKYNCGKHSYYVEQGMCEAAMRKMVARDPNPKCVPPAGTRLREVLPSEHDCTKGCPPKIQGRAVLGEKGNSRTNFGYGGGGPSQRS